MSELPDILLSCLDSLFELHTVPRIACTFSGSYDPKNARSCGQVDQKLSVEWRPRVHIPGILLLRTWIPSNKLLTQVLVRVFSVLRQFSFQHNKRFANFQL